MDNIAGYFDSEEVANAGLATESYEFKTPEDVVNQFNNGDVYLVDVRRQAEWNEGHVPQSAYSFLGSMMNDVTELPSDKPIVFLCRTGARSAVACSIAQAKGVTNVINLAGGIVDWELQSYSVVTDNPQAAV